VTASASERPTSAGPFSYRDKGGRRWWHGDWPARSCSFARASQAVSRKAPILGQACRFRFDFAPPTRVVIISDGKHLAIQDYGLNTDDRKELSQTPFRPLVLSEVDLMRDALISDVRESDDTITIAFTDTNAQAGSVKLFLGTKPAIQLKGWIIRDNQRLDTRVDLTEVQPVSRIDQRLFDLSSRLERTQW